MQKDTITPEQSLDNENIFEDFATDDSLGKEVEILEEKKKKDLYFYLWIASTTLKILNAFLLIVIATGLVYFYIQNQEETQDYSILSPICYLFLGQSSSETETCYGVTYYLQQVEKNTQTETELQVQEITAVLGDIYLVNNFIYSQVVDFLLRTSKNRLTPTTILSEFDALKNKFEPIDKSKISCSNIVISKPWIFEARCEAYSSDWDSQVSEIQSGILWVSDSGGTSISVASSFIDFIENAPESNFTLIEKQKVFFTTDVIGKGIYTKKTPFTLNLKYNDSQSLDF